MSPTLNYHKNETKKTFIFNNTINNELILNQNLVFESMPDLQPILEFDASDEVGDQIDGNVMSGDQRGQRGRHPKRSPNKFKPTEAVVRKQAPTFLLIESLIWNFCCFNETDKQKQKILFGKLCQRLQEFKIIGSTYRSDSLHPIREFILIKFKELVSRIRDEDKELNPFSLTSCGLTSNTIISSAHLIDQSSRYEKEFIDLGLIEEGGFGFVNRAKYRFDDCEYAVKMIRFKYKSDTDFKKITREVQLYANLSSHPNVVAYKTAWLENWCLHREKIPLINHVKTTEDHQTVSQLESSDEECVKTSATDKSDEDSILFEESSKSGIRFEASVQHMEETFDLNVTKSMEMNDCEDEEEEEDEECDDNISEDLKDGIKMHSFNDLSTVGQSVVKRRKTFSMSSTASQSDSAVEYRDCYELQRYKHNIPDIKVENYELKGCPFSCSDFGAILYIQMELCGRNLKTWIRERNQRVSKVVKDLSSEYILNSDQTKEGMGIFRQILKGVEYIHSQHLIHRDLKPQNILFSADGSTVKIGDFGLATLHNSIDNEEISLNIFKPNHQSDTEDNDHTGGIGTSIYAAPEQKVKLLNRNYDNKTDLFSLGIILFELFYPLSTDMEKYKCVTNLTKKRVLPEILQRFCPNVAKIILALTLPNPIHRPNATEVLNSSLFLSEEQLIIKQIERQNKRLNEELVLKDNRIEELEERLKSERKMNAQKDIEIESLRKELELMAIKGHKRH